MILHKIDAEGFTFLPFEGDAPRAVDMDTVPLGLAPETVKAKPWNSQVLQSQSLIEDIQSSKYPGM